MDHLPTAMGAVTHYADPDVRFLVVTYVHSRNPREAPVKHEKAVVANKHHDYHNGPLNS